MCVYSALDPISRCPYHAFGRLLTLSGICLTVAHSVTVAKKFLHSKVGDFGIFRIENSTK
jgi:hypothetical protein